MGDNVTEVTAEALAIDNPLENPIIDPVAKRHAEQMAGSAQEVARMRTLAVDSIAKASEKSVDVFLETHSKDPKLANEVAKALGYANAQEIIDSINAPKEPKGFTEADIEKIVSEREAKKEHAKAITKAEKLLDKLPADLRDEAQSRFDKISKGQMLDEETAIEFAEMATLYVNKDNLRADVLNDSLAMLGSTGVGKSKKVTEKEPQYVVRDGKLVLLSNE